MPGSAAVFAPGGGGANPAENAAKTRRKWENFEKTIRKKLGKKPKKKRKNLGKGEKKWENKPIKRENPWKETGRPWKKWKKGKNPILVAELSGTRWTLVTVFIPYWKPTDYMQELGKKIEKLEQTCGKNT